MSTEATLRAEAREDFGKGAARKLRASGRVPAVLYGEGGKAMSLSIDAREAQHLFQAISVENTLVDLDIAGEKARVRTLVREIQVHPFRPTLLHVDFYRIQMDVMVEVEIPIHLVGVPDGVRSSGGILQQTIHELPVRCLPGHIPDSLDIDVSGLELGASIHVSDIHFGEGVEVLVEADRTVCSVVAPRVTAEEIEGVAAEEIGAELEGAAGEAAGEAEEDEA